MRSSQFNSEQLDQLSQNTKNMNTTSTDASSAENLIIDLEILFRNLKTKIIDQDKLIQQMRNENNEEAEASGKELSQRKFSAFWKDGELDIAKKIITEMKSCRPFQRSAVIEDYAAFFRAVSARVELEKSFPQKGYSVAIGNSISIC